MKEQAKISFSKAFPASWPVCPHLYLAQWLVPSTATFSTPHNSGSVKLSFVIPIGTELTSAVFRRQSLKIQAPPRPPVRSQKPRSEGTRHHEFHLLLEFLASLVSPGALQAMECEIRQNGAFHQLCYMPHCPLTSLFRCLTGISNMSSWSCLINLLLLESSPSLLVATLAFWPRGHKILESS